MAILRWTPFRLRGALGLPLACVLALAGPACSLGQAGPPGEYQLKAAFLFNFAKFVEWPPQSFHAPDQPVMICVLGANPFGDALEQVIGGKLVNGRPFAVRPLRELTPDCGCHLLFVPASEGRRFFAALPAVRGAGILTVGEAEGFASEGGVINLKLESGRIRFEINLEAAARERLHISSKLLQLAQIVKRA